MAVRTASGIILRNPAEKAKRFARQMSNGKISETGQELDRCGMAYRAGYLQARKDNANAYNSKRGKRSNKKNKR